MREAQTRKFEVIWLISTFRARCCASPRN